MHSYWYNDTNSLGDQPYQHDFEIKSFHEYIEQFGVIIHLYQLPQGI